MVNLVLSVAHPVLYVINTSGVGAKPLRVANINLAYPEREALVEPIWSCKVFGRFKFFNFKGQNHFNKLIVT